MSVTIEGNDIPRNYHYDGVFIDEVPHSFLRYEWSPLDIPLPVDRVWKIHDKNAIEDIISRLEFEIVPKVNKTQLQVLDDILVDVNSYNIDNYIINSYIDRRSSKLISSSEPIEINSAEIISLLSTVLSYRDGLDQRFLNILESKILPIKEIGSKYIDKNSSERYFNLEDPIYQMVTLAFSYRVAQTLARDMYGTINRGMSFAGLIEPKSSFLYIKSNRRLLDFNYLTPSNQFSWYWNYSLPSNPNNRQVIEFFRKYKSNDPLNQYANHIEFFYLRFLLGYSWITIGRNL